MAFFAMMRKLVYVGVFSTVLVASIAAGLVIFCPAPSVDAPDSSRHVVEFDIERDPDVPSLPFDDNPDPSQCGIPVQWGGADSEAWLTGEWHGELIQPDVLLYDSHLRVSVTGKAPHGARVEVILFQENPVLDYYFVRVAGTTVREGWVPEPFLSFDPVP